MNLLIVSSSVQFVRLNDCLLILKNNRRKRFVFSCSMGNPKRFPQFFRNFVYGREFEEVSDDKAFTSILKGNRANKTFSSRLTRWVDRSLPFQLNVVQVLGRTMGMADCLSRYPSENSSFEQKIKAEELSNSWFTVNEITNRNSIVLATANQNTHIAENQPIEAKVTRSSELQLRAVVQK